MNELPRVLISSLALMEMVGFNAHQCENGLTARGDAMRQKKKNQGPITAQCLAENICKLTQEEMERLFNQMCSLLARQGLFRGKLLVALDGSKLPTPKRYEGCGKVKQTRKVKVKGQKEKATEEYYVYGWKIMVLIEVQTRLPPVGDQSGANSRLRGKMAGSFVRASTAEPGKCRADREDCH